MGLNRSELLRYGRHLSLNEFDEEQQLCLKRARVLIIGCGGLGCPCAIYLAAAGVGKLGIMDDDVVEETGYGGDGGL